MGRMSILGAALWPVEMRDEGDFVESSSVGESHPHALPEPDMSLSSERPSRSTEGSFVRCHLACQTPQLSPNLEKLQL